MSLDYAILNKRKNHFNEIKLRGYAPIGAGGKCCRGQ